MMSFLLDAARFWWDGFWSAWWQVGLAVAAAGLLLGALPRLSARARSWVWRAVHLQVFVLWFWPAPIEVPLLASNSPVAAAGLDHGGPAAGEAVSSVAPLVLFSIWTAGLLLLCRRHLRGWRSLARLRAGATARHDARVASITAELGRPPLQVLVVRGLGSPFVCGVRRPVLVMPADLELDDRRLRALLAHECAHVARRDVLWSGIMAAARVLLWCQPLVWWAGRRAARAAELACDADALHTSGVRPAHLAETLVRVAARTSRPPALPSTSMASGGAAALQERLFALDGPRGSTRCSFAVALLFIAAVLTPFELVEKRAAGASGTTGAAPAAEGERVWLYRNRGGAVLHVVVRPAPEGGLVASVARHPEGRRAELRVADLDELRRKDDEAWRFVRSSVRPTPERRWLFGPSEGDDGS